MIYQKMLMNRTPYMLTVGKATAFALHRHPEIEISYCLEGSYSFCVEGKNYELKKGELAIIRPLAAHAFFESSGCRFTAEVGPAMLAEDFHYFLAQRSDVLVFDLERSCELRGILEELELLHATHPPFYLLAVQGKLYCACACLLQMTADERGIEIPPDRRSVTKITIALEMIYRRYGEQLSIEEVCRACGYSRSNFCKVFKAVTGETFHCMLNRHRVETACLYLRETSEPIERIAQNVGFLDSKSFCRVFKHIIGISAGAYRRKWKA